MKRLKFFAERANWGRRIDIRFGELFDGRVISEAIAITMKSLPEDEAFAPEPALSLDLNGAQNLMDELWNAGVRPTEGTGSAGSLAATERHLEDMRSIVFSTQPPGLKKP